MNTAISAGLPNRPATPRRLAVRTGANVAQQRMSTCATTASGR
jgi:hypothetical protein